MNTVVHTGFPSPTDDYKDEGLSIDGYLIRNQVATFFFQVAGDELATYGLHDGDMLVVDRSVAPMTGHIVVAFVSGQRIVCRLSARDGKPVLEVSDTAQPIELRDLSLYTAESDLPCVWGVVVGQFKRIAYLGACD